MMRENSNGLSEAVTFITNRLIGNNGEIVKLSFEFEIVKKLTLISIALDLIAKTKRALSRLLMPASWVKSRKLRYF